MSFPHADFEKVLQGVKDKVGLKFNTELKQAIHVVFGSWNNPRANTYGIINDIPHIWGTAVYIVTIVFDNIRDTSAIGDAFTRNPATGEKVLFNEYLINAQGEDVHRWYQDLLIKFRMQEKLLKVQTYHQWKNQCRKCTKN